ncbi:MAG: hypothetical protein DLM57_00805 [Pseudonocardiales bacterium]|nr:MAG: hypothetical protein DLM57_00805 [Pseudonocardiales bacterium]
MPWVNPARRGHVAAAAIVGALLFGGGGLLVGHAVSGHGDHRGGMRLERGPGPGGGAPGFGRDPRFRNGGGPRPNVPIGPNGPGLPRPTPTASSSPSR